MILAGGKGVRLRPLTYTIPKPLLPVGEKPILEEIIERLKPFGVRRIRHRRRLSRGADRDVLPRRRAARRAHRLRARVASARHGRAAGARARRRSTSPPDEPLLVMNGDILTDLDMRAFVEFHRARRLRGDRRDAGVRAAASVRRAASSTASASPGIVEKPAVTDIVSAGIYAIQPSALDVIPRRQLLRHAGPREQAASRRAARVGAYQFVGEWLAIDRIEQLEDAGADDRGAARVAVRGAPALDRCLLPSCPFVSFVVHPLNR